MVGVTRFILRHQRAVLAGVIVLVGLGVWQRTRLKESQSLQELVVRGDPRRTVFEQMQRDFGGDEVLAVAVDADTVYRPEALAAIDTLSGWLRGLEGVGRVTSLTTEQRLEVASVLGVPMGLRWVPLYAPGGGEEGARRMRDYVRAHPLYAQRLVSRDEATALIIVQFRERDSERINAVTRQIQDGLAEHERGGVRLYLAGYPLIRSELIRASRRDVDRLLFIALGVIVFILSVAFRRPGPVLLAAGVIGAGVVVAMGAIAALGIRMNNLLAMVPALVLIIGSSTSMHLLTRYRVERDRGADRQGAAARALIHVGPGCFWASATTAIGFLGLMVSRVPALRQCGACSAVGVALSFVVAVALIPAVLTLRRRGAPAWEPTAADLQAAARPSGITLGVGWFVRRFARPILAVAALAAGASVYGITQLDVETNRLEYFRPTDPLRVAYQRIEDQFGGLTEIDVLIRGPHQGWLNPEAVRQLDLLEQSLGALEDIDGSISLVALMKHVNQAFGGPYAIPIEPAQQAAFLQLAATHGGDWWAMFVAKDRPVTRLALFTRLKGSAHLEGLISEVTEVVERHRPAGTQAQVTGSAVVFAGMVRYVVAGQIQGLMMVMGILLVIMSLLARRVRAGLVCLLPTIVPILMLYGVMAAAGIALNLHTSIVSALAAGIAIDNAIHMLNAFKRAYQRTGDYAGSIDRAIHVIGRALIINGVLLAGGLGAFTQGVLLPVMQFGMLLALTMVNAMIMGLLLLPALMLVLRPGIGRQRGQPP